MEETKPKTIHCAIYTRKSTEEGLEQDFNSLDAQRESAEAYITSQKSQGWTCIPEHYDDGGFTGGNMNRPSLVRLLDDIDTGRIQCVVVYKVDRLSRCLMDFAKILERFEQKNVSFVSVTQLFNSATSMGRLTLNILLSFAQFEREMISERTRDKIALARKRGKYIGGRPVLGYNLSPEGGKLVINPDEAEQVRTIYNLYLKTNSTLTTIEELDHLGWKNKRWITRKGTLREGHPFTKNSLHALLTNPLYIGKVQYKDQLYDGEHEGFIDPELFQKVQQTLANNRRHTKGIHPGKYGGILKGILRCKACNCGMSHSFSKKGNKRYRYYVCQNAVARGWSNCPHPSLPADEMERFVVDEIRKIGFDEKLIDAVVAESLQSTHEEIAIYEKRYQALQREIADSNNRLKILAASSACEDTVKELASLQDKIRLAEREMKEGHLRLDYLKNSRINADEIRQACRKFDPIWDTLSSKEQWRMLTLLLDQVEFDTGSGSIKITFQPSGVKQLNEEMMK